MSRTSLAFSSRDRSSIGPSGVGNSDLTRNHTSLELAVHIVETVAAAAYCVDSGGVVRERTAVLNPNLPRGQWVELGGARGFCEFTGGEGADPDTWVSIPLDTLHAETPTLAAIAYLTKPAMPEMTGGSNPSAAYCVHLGGAYGFGGNPVGWVTEDPELAISVVNYCVLGDGSMIDAWGLSHHTGDVIRGADLTAILRYQPDIPPAVFPDHP